MTGPGCGWSKISRVRAPYDNLDPAVKPLQSPESAVYIMDSLLASLITYQPLRPGSSQQYFAAVALRSLECLDSLSSFFGGLVALPQVVLERGWICKVATHHCVDIGQAKRVIGLHDSLGRGTGIEGMDHQLQEHATLADAKNSRRFLTERDRDRERFKINGCHGYSSSVYRISTIIVCPFASPSTAVSRTGLRFSIPIFPSGARGLSELSERFLLTLAAGSRIIKNVCLLMAGGTTEAMAASIVRRERHATAQCAVWAFCNRPVPRGRQVRPSFKLTSNSV